METYHLATIVINAMVVVGGAAKLYGDLRVLKNDINWIKENLKDKE